ncbi:hypothetical protein FBZ84_101132 [Azospirillum baldaniorum]|uniref:hypothetical protein n=1 Tax=Azospirillum baldaniorum TaxID=1064539 RepID=UPI0011A01332|nr:hypothetical protein [Azospirillum baldaniorum]TWA71866.1 hypothetical protein FBZ84_101132 [Azospirillum baldaniorum]
MGHLSKLAEEEAATLAKLLGEVRRFDFALSDAFGPECRHFPGLKSSVGSVRDALEDLQGDIRGTLTDLDPDNLTGWNELRNWLSSRAPAKETAP